MNKDYLTDLFIDEAKAALKRWSGSNDGSNDGSGSDEGDSSAPAVLSELTVTENGEYLAQRLQPGNSYALKNEYTADELVNLYHISACLIDTGNYRLFLSPNNADNPLFCLLMYTSYDNSFSYGYIPKKVYDLFPNMFPAAGWIDVNGLPVEAPSITIPTDPSYLCTDLANIALVFDAYHCDGFSKVNVNVTVGGGVPLEKIFIDRSGTYSAKQEIVPGGTYSFKSHYTDQELEQLYRALGGKETGSGRVSFTNPNLPSKYSLMIMREDYAGYTGWAIICAGGTRTYIGEELSQYSSNGVPGWYDTSGGGVGNAIPPPTITLPENAEGMVPKMYIEQLLTSAEGYNEIVVDTFGPIKATSDDEMAEILARHVHGTVCKFVSSDSNKFMFDRYYITSYDTGSSYCWRTLDITAGEIVN